MRLIHSVTRQLQDFSQGEVPPYAILSHTWGEEEVSFQNISSPRCELYKGYGKILQACNVAAEHGLEYVWIDTCCIDKTNSAELMESINSMYSWYSDAVVCYVYLEDLGPDSKIEDSLQGCRWFTRGWTLQELLAPRIVELYDKDWCFRGTSLDFVHCISRITGIEQSVLRGGAIADCSVAMRMSWAARRRTTRIEDISYCLLGIFDVHMPLMYGEGSAAFRRLQEEIIKRNNDTTIFAWENDLSQDPKLLGAFAPSPAFFKDCSQVGPFAGQFPDFSATNKGILVSPEMHVRAVSTEKYDAGSAGHLRTRSYLLYLGHHVMHCDVVGIHLRKIGPNLFVSLRLLFCLPRRRRHQADSINCHGISMVSMVIHNPRTCLLNALSFLYLEMYLVRIRTNQRSVAMAQDILQVSESQRILRQTEKLQSPNAILLPTSVLKSRD